MKGGMIIFLEKKEKTLYATFKLSLVINFSTLHFSAIIAFSCIALPNNDVLHCIDVTLFMLTLHNDYSGGIYY